MQESSEVRQILCLEALQPQENLVPALRSAGWDPVFARDLNTAQSLIESHRFRVGLVHFDSASDSMPGFYTPQLLNNNGCIEWVGVLPKHAISTDPVLRLIRDYFYDFHTLPVDLERLTATLGHAYGMASVKNLKQEDCVSHSDHEMVGASSVMQTLLHDIRKVAATEAVVLIAGESGTGKELAAKAIHEHSRRSSRALVAINCGSLPSSLIQSELFGYEKGAFTGASQRRIGLIEKAAGGTIFLDEIGDLPLDLQTNLLRFLQEGTINRVGGTELIPVDVRVIAATHVDLEKAVEEGRFREDLYYRLNVLQLKVPPLRERGEDIELLARFLFQKFANEK
ncbi:MAG: sigma 54-interacting transcriptional regulator, partial [Burkholderiales bacterium]